jgi:hypothetical protein
LPAAAIVAVFNPGDEFVVRFTSVLPATQIEDVLFAGVRRTTGGDRRANRALYMIEVAKKVVIRCPKRFIAREVFYDLKQNLLKTLA